MKYRNSLLSGAFCTGLLVLSACGAPQQIAYFRHHVDRRQGCLLLYGRQQGQYRFPCVGNRSCGKPVA